MSNDRDWNLSYVEGDTPWDSKLVSRELRKVLKEQDIKPCRALELGCGTGTNAIYLAQKGFDVTAVELSERALEMAALQAQRASTNVNFVLHDACNLHLAFEPFDFVFDRGCYHCARKVDLTGFRSTLEHLTKPGTLWLTLTGNANDPSDDGPPKLTEQEIRDDLSDLFEIKQIREFHFEDEGGLKGPLGWSCLLERK